jgi:hypothetical protein
MTTLATRARELGQLEGFDVEFLDAKGNPVDMKNNGFAKYSFDRKANGSVTVSDWRERRFQQSYPGYGCTFLNGDGSEAHGNTKLESVRASYEEP